MRYRQIDPTEFGAQARKALALEMDKQTFADELEARRLETITTSQKVSKRARKEAEAQVSQARDRAARSRQATDAQIQRSGIGGGELAKARREHLKVLCAEKEREHILRSTAIGEHEQRLPFMADGDEKERMRAAIDAAKEALPIVEISHELLLAELDKLPPEPDDLPEWRQKELGMIPTPQGTNLPRETPEVMSDPEADSPQPPARRKPRSA